ncbi:hypothetical protein BDW74DRAFT_185903 [Aspergillus multicolor]|uniref:uncharacterized protein n=1 Tax=Aspergillus multicolor TaxID=41759 RepID=UPI003CCE134F
MGFKYKPEQCDAAIQGKRVPERLNGCHILCLIRGIRYHHGFATELQGHYRLKSINRALHARSIMSNIVPDFNSADDMPYCIWHPEVATEDTYRKLSARYPELRYQVGRACAVAGYVDLYKELDLLPDVHIAEEARDNGCAEIFDMIMGQADRYDVMNDYTRTVNVDNPRKACLNGDTAVRSSLEVKQEHSRDFKSTHYFNITEDQSIGIDTTPAREATADDVSPLLYSPLPMDLPTVNKDLLILMAAYYGDIDRYVRLRRPVMIQYEYIFVIRGIFHNTMFAKWWSFQDLTMDDGRLDDSSELRAIQWRIDRAITARFIMNNDLSRILSRPDTAPDCIWYPTLASPETYGALAKRIPRMVGRVARACIVGNYVRTYENLPDFKPTEPMMREAKESRNPFFLEDLRRRAMEHGIDLDSSPEQDYEYDKIYPTVRQLHEKSTGRLDKKLGAFSVAGGTEFHNVYDGYACGITAVEVSLCAPDEWKKEDYQYFEDMYKGEEFLQGFQE